MFLDNIMIALTALKSNKMRSLLTMLGIVIGISSVIAILCLGDALKSKLTGTFDKMTSMGIDFVVYYKEFEDENDLVYRPKKEKDLVTEEMILDVKDHFGDRIEGVMLSDSPGEGSITEKDKTVSVEFAGVNSTMLSKQELEVLEGRTLNANDYQNSAKTAVISDKAAKKLYGNNLKNAVGKNVEILTNGKMFSFTIVGVYKYSQTYTNGDTTTIYIPLKTSFSMTNSDILFDRIKFVPKQGELAETFIDDVSKYINERYYKNNDLYEIFGWSQATGMKEAEKMINMLKAAIAAIAGISLLVGGIGVMNIMVVSITERTREIGTRKALGAENGSIRMQFITEAIVICVIGGIIGIILGNAIGYFVSQKLMNAPGAVSPAATAGCVLFSMFFGVFFGYMPANKAAKLNPIDALRYE